MGDVVQLKSGGPKMTINDFNGTAFAACVWFDAEDKRQTGVFAIEALKLADA